MDEAAQNLDAGIAGSGLPLPHAGRDRFSRTEVTITRNDAMK